MNNVMLYIVEKDGFILVEEKKKDKEERIPKAIWQMSQAEDRVYETQGARDKALFQRFPRAPNIVVFPMKRSTT